MFKPNAIILFIVLGLVEHSLSFDRSKCDCKLGSAGRIVGGGVLKGHQYPWQISLQVPGNGPKLNRHFCGGTILNEYWIMSAAHCMNHNIMQIGYGSNDLERTIPVKVVEKRIYPNYKKNPNDNGDIALLRLEKPLPLDGIKAKPACLPNAPIAINNNTPMTAIGWGATAPLVTQDGKTIQTGPLSRLLKAADFYPNPCQDPWQICTRPVKQGDGVCPGDSGSSLQINVKGKTVVVGVASATTGRREGNVIRFCYGHEIYTKVSKGLNWIKQNIGNNYCTM